MDTTQIYFTDKKLPFLSTEEITVFAKDLEFLRREAEGNGLELHEVRQEVAA